MRPRLHTLSQGSRVRRLLIEGNDLADKTLSQLVDGVRTVVARGKQYEVENKADSLMQEWIKNEGFEYRKEGGPPAFEPLQPTITLVMLMGYTKIYDPKQKKGMNLIGEVPLAQWQGWKDKNGEDYEYGFNGTTLYGKPKVTAKHGVNMTPKNNEELIAVLRQATQIEKSLGPVQTFILGD